MSGRAPWSAYQFMNNVNLRRPIRLILNPRSDHDAGIRATLFRRCKHPMRNEVERICFRQPYMPIDSRALIEPALDLASVDADHQRVRPAVIDVIGDLAAKSHVAALVAAHQVTVEPYFALSEN